MREGIATCDAVEAGESCDCGGNWDTEIMRTQWRNTTYNILTWSTSEDVVNVIPTTTVLAQAFFNCKSPSSYLHALRVRV